MVLIIVHCTSVYACLYLAIGMLDGKSGCTSKLTLKVQITSTSSNIIHMTISGSNGVISSSQPRPAVFQARTSHQQGSLPYINFDLKHLIRKKQRCFRQATNLNSEWYNKAQNKVMSALRSAKKGFFSNLSWDVKTLRDFWATYN